MPTASVPLVDAADIRRFVGQGAYDRARAYARGGAVLDLGWDAEVGRLSALVAGSTDTPYRCRIDLVPAAGEYHRPTASDCSCPVGTGCKHVAAALLRSNAEHVAALAGDGAAHSAAPSEPKTTEPAWKAALAALADGRAPVASNDSAFRAESLTPLALQFEVREVIRNRRGRWQHSPTSTIAASVRSTGKLRLTVRPVIRGKSSRWIAGDVGWGSLAYRVSRLDLDERQVRWFGQILALSRAVSGVYLGQDQERVVLDDFPSALLWDLLDEACGLGIELVNAAKFGTVQMAGDAQIGLDAARSGSGDLHLGTVVTLGGVRVDPGALSPIGDHGLYLVEWAPVPTITLARAVQPLTAARRALLTQPRIEIPAGDVDEFLGSYYPAMRRSVAISSTDTSVRLPEIVPPTLVLTTRFEPEHTLHLDWGWEYRVGEAALRTPLRPDADAAYRDAAAEAETLAVVLRVWPSGSGDLAPSSELHSLDAAEFVEHTLPALEALDGIRVDAVGDRPDYRELHGTPTLKVSTVETDQRDWFDLGVLVSVDGRSVPFGPLFTALSLGKTKLLLIDNSYLSLRQPVFDRLRELIAEAHDLSEWATGPRINRYQASLWADFEDLADESEQALAWRESVGGLLELAASAAGSDAGPDAGLGAIGAPATSLPTGLTATLRPYQLDGYGWLSFLWRYSLGGILADDMGLGKTLQTLALIAHVIEDRAAASETGAPFLVVAPSSVVANWVLEAARFAPHLRVSALTATQAKSGVPLAQIHADADVIVTSYALFRLDYAAYAGRQWSGLILDEAQFVKNHAAKAHQCARDLPAPFKLAITGTPMENNLMELWSLFQIVAPGLFPSSRRFTEEYVRPIAAATSVALGADASGGAAVLAKLRRRIRPLMLRRTKDVVAPELPAKQEQVLQIVLAPKHRKLYDTFLQRERQKLLGLIEDLDRNRFIVFRSLTLLRMLSLDASLVDDKYSSVPSSKLDALFEQLEDVLAEGHRALIFSQFTSFLAKVAARLDERGVDYAYLDGSTRRRASVIKRFQDGSAPLFLISLKAGGFGLNLTEADYVFLLDPWWNPAAEAQAVDRTHRIGQTKNVMVYRMVASGTIEEKVMALKEQKARLFDAVLDDGAAFGGALSADDIRGLLEG